VSSAILYVAIVAIWIGVLVPRWLRHENSHSGQVGLRRFSRHFGTGTGTGRPADEPERRAGFDPDAHTPVSYPESRSYYEEQVSSPVSGNKENMAQLYEADAPADTDVPPAPHGVDHADVRVPRPRAPHDHDAMADAERRDRIVRGRRRMLWLLLVLTGVGVGLAYLQLAAWWVMIPPVLLLGGYLLLLREAAHADAEARERRELARTTARAHHASEAPGREKATVTATAAAPAHETGPHADIIDLSEHVEDQLYDQYTDAKLRAVGD
jgi:hypothetical protein